MTVPLTRRTFLRTTGAAGLLGAVSRAGATPPDGSTTDAHEVLVGVAPSADSVRSTVERHVPRVASVAAENRTLGYATVTFPAEAADAATEFIDTAQRSPAIEYAEPNVVYRGTATPNDPRFNGQRASRQVNAPEAWDTTFGDRDVTIAMIETGIEYDSHPDLQNSTGADAGYDFVGDDDRPLPEPGEVHGTEVAGIATARTNNDEGIAGLSQSTLLCVRVGSETGSGIKADAAAVADGIEWATDHDADVINVSLGRAESTETVGRAVEYAESQGALIVAAAGNESGGQVYYPAARKECVAVAALDGEDVADFSSTGPEIELAAPGTNLLTTTLGGDYTRFTGTSAAAPVVSGIAGLALARWDLTGPELRTHLRETAVDLGLSAEKQGAGRVDAANAVQVRPDGTGLKPINGYANPPTDPDDDGRYEDVNGDGDAGIVDVQALFANRDDDVVASNPDAFDFNGDGSTGIVDVQALFTELAG
ncbi:peptidase S8 [Halobacteriales archaeon QS_4_69_34]|nr:MAG: peptidase S8 [Halobacteriales archaeon QS_4_69_34]